MAVQFISASNVKVGIGSVTMDLPPVWAPGDLLLIMSYSPSRASAVPTMGPRSWQYYPSWMYTRRATADEVPPVYTFAGDPSTPIGGFVSAWRGVHPTRALSTFQYAPEYGAVHASPGVIFGPYATPGSITTPGCEIVYCYQSESTDNHLTELNHTALSLATRAASKAAIYGTPFGWPYGLYTLGLGMYSARMAGTGAPGSISWRVTNDSNVQPFYLTNEVSFFSAIALPPAPFTIQGEYLGGGTVRLHGDLDSGVTVTVGGVDGHIGPVATTGSTWECIVSAVPPGPVTFTATDGSSPMSVTVQVPGMQMRDSGTSHSTPIRDTATGKILAIRRS